MSVVSTTSDVPFCQSMRYMKDHMSGVVGRSHCTSTLGGTGLAMQPRVEKRPWIGWGIYAIIYIIYVYI